MKWALILALMTLSHMQLSYGNEHSFSAKHYVYADQVSLSSEGIIIRLDEVNLLTPSIFHDEDGLYFLEDGVQWICRNCGYLNDLDDSTCRHCGES